MRSSQLLQSAGAINLAKTRLPTIQGQGLKDIHVVITKARKIGTSDLEVQGQASRLGGLVQGLKKG
jgi:hypothetical protein